MPAVSAAGFMEALSLSAPKKRQPPAGGVSRRFHGSALSLSSEGATALCRRYQPPVSWKRSLFQLRRSDIAVPAVSAAGFMEALSLSAP